MLIIRAGIYKMLVRIANSEDLDRLLLQKQCNLGLHCFSRPFWQASSVGNFRTSTIISKNPIWLTHHMVNVVKF